MPPAWKSRAEMAGAVTLLLAANSYKSLAQTTSQAINGNPAIVAPIFEHGEGRGATGCVVVTPPVFLSEQDTMQVIREELRKAGVDPSEAKVPVEGVRTTKGWSDVRLKGVKGTIRAPQPESKPFAVDAFDPKKKVGVEFVGEEEYFDLGGEYSLSSVQDYHFNELAKTLSQQVRTNGRGIYFGAFYDPVTYTRKGELYEPEFRNRIDTLYRERSKATDPKVVAEKEKEIHAQYDQKLAPRRARSKRLLRQQVKDFIDWLKGQGVI